MGVETESSPSFPRPGKWHLWGEVPTTIENEGRESEAEQGASLLVFKTGMRWVPGPQTLCSLHTLPHAHTGLREPTEMEQESWEPRWAQQDAKSQGTHFLLLRGPRPGAQGTLGSWNETTRPPGRAPLLPPRTLGNNGTMWVGGELSWSQGPKCRCLWGLTSQVTEAQGTGADQRGCAL